MKSMSKWLNIFIYLLEKMYNYTLFLRECDLRLYTYVFLIK